MSDYLWSKEKRKSNTTKSNIPEPDSGRRKVGNVSQKKLQAKCVSLPEGLKVYYTICISLIYEANILRGAACVEQLNVAITETWMDWGKLFSSEYELKGYN